MFLLFRVRQGIRDYSDREILCLPYRFVLFPCRDDCRGYGSADIFCVVCAMMSRKKYQLAEGDYIFKEIKL